MGLQDMPPPGGFGEIPVERTFAKPIFRRGFGFAFLIISSILGPLYCSEWRVKFNIKKTEQIEHYIAASPFALAENERKFLNRLYYVREDERQLMKDHPGWIVGTLYGEKIFKTVPKNTIPPLRPDDILANRGIDEYIENVHIPDLYD